MPETITGSPTTYDNNLSIPQDFDVASMPLLKAAFQRVINNARWLYDKVVTSGVLAIRSASDIAGLQSLTGMTNLQVCLVRGKGVFFYIASAVDTPVPNFIVQPTTGGGRWLHSLYALRNAANGVAGLDAAAKVPAAQIPNALVSVFSATRTNIYDYGVTEADVTGSEINIAGCLEGDKLEVDYLFEAAFPFNNTVGSATTKIVAGSAATVVTTLGGSSDTSVTTMIGTYVCTAADEIAGSVTVRLRAIRTVDLTGCSLRLCTIRARLYRP